MRDTVKTEERKMRDTVKTDCICFAKDYEYTGKPNCNGLKDLYCKNGPCSFYKSNTEYAEGGAPLNK